MGPLCLNRYSKPIKKLPNKLFIFLLRDFKFYSILPAMLASSFIITGIVINQTFIIESKDWGKFSMAQSFMIYSILTVITLFFSGFFGVRSSYDF